MTLRRLFIPVMLASLIVGVGLGSVGTAAAGGLTKGAVKKIATKVVKKKGKTLSVAHAASADNAGALAGQPPSAYQDNATVYTISVPTATDAIAYTIPTTPGASYALSYDADLLTSATSSQSTCLVYLVVGTAPPTGLAVSAGYSNSTINAHSASDVVTMPAGGRLLFSCTGSDFFTNAQAPIHFTVTPLDSLSDGGTPPPT